MLNQFLTNIFVLKNNINNLYYNTIEKEGSSFRLYLEDDINEVNKIYSNLVKLIKKIGSYPILNLEEIKNISTIKEISSKDYTIKEANSLLLNDLSVVNSMNNQVGEYALKNYDLSSINLVLDFNNYLSKRIYLLKKDNR